MSYDKPEYISFKKLLIFNTEVSEKTTLNKIFIEYVTFSNEIHEENGKLY